MGDIFNAFDSGDREKSIDDFKLLLFIRQVFPGLWIFDKGCKTKRKGILFIIVFKSLALSHGAIKGYSWNILAIDRVVFHSFSAKKTFYPSFRKLRDYIVNTRFSGQSDQSHRDQRQKKQQLPFHTQKIPILLKLSKRRSQGQSFCKDFDITLLFIVQLS